MTSDRGGVDIVGSRLGGTKRARTEATISRANLPEARHDVHAAATGPDGSNRIEKFGQTPPADLRPPFTDLDEPFQARPVIASRRIMREEMTDNGTTDRAALEVRDAAKKFGATQALAGASFDVRAGELLGLLGPNGAGKTTMIKAIAGRAELDAGSIRLFGREIKRSDPRPDLGVVPQEIALYKLMTARENLAAFGALYGVAGAELKQRVDWALEWSGLADRASHLSKTFSGGMLRRLNIACSLLHQPKLVLLDEPTVGVDPQSRERIYEMLAVLKRDGVSVVLTTHHLEEAERRCERIVIIDHGRIVAAGTMSELVAQAMGRARVLAVQLGDPLGDDVALPAGWLTDEHRVEVRVNVDDIARDVPARLAELVGLGAHVRGMDVTGASLQDVFIALTGRELRE